MKKTVAILALILSFHGFSVAGADECKNRAQALVQKYVDIMEEFSTVRSFEIVSFRKLAESSGSHQEYESKIKFHQEMEPGVFEDLALKFTFTSPHECDNLRIGFIEDGT